MDLHCAGSWVAERKLYRDTNFILPEQGNAERGVLCGPELMKTVKRIIRAEISCGGKMSQCKSTF